MVEGAYGNHPLVSSTKIKPVMYERKSVQKFKRFAMAHAEFLLAFLEVRHEPIEANQWILTLGEVCNIYDEEERSDGFY
tara:strand:- start:332 stop:568 length:237 start_codon:yes stop_codon:yes gene_type:complete